MEKWKSEVKNRFNNFLVCDKTVATSTSFLRRIVINEEKAEFYFDFSDEKEQGDCFPDVVQMTKDAMDYMEMAWDVSFPQHEGNATVCYYREEGDTWERKYLPIGLFPSFFSITPKITEAEFQNLTRYVENTNEYKIPLGFLLLKECRTIEDSRSCFISIINACEIGVKEFYSLERPDTGLLLNKMPSPPLDVLLCKDMLSQYFDLEIPKPLISQLKKSIEKRNKLVHSNKEAPTKAETADCYHTVLRILNILNKEAHPDLYRKLYDEKMYLKTPGEQESKIEMSEPLRRAVERGEVNTTLLVAIQHVNNNAEPSS